MVMMIDKIMTVTPDSRGEGLHLVADGIKQPLDKIRELIKLAKAKSDGQEVAQILDLALQSSEKLNDRISAILLSGIEDSEQKQVIDFTAVINDIKDSLSYMPGIGITKFILRIDEECEYRANVSLIQSILHNLIHNAVQYRSNNVSSNMVIISVCKAGAGMVITISDNGQGIEPERIPYLFNEVSAPGVSVHRKGLGLPMVKRNVAKLGGQVKVQSTPGEGSTFTISLPYVSC